MDMFYKKQPVENQESYKNMLKKLGVYQNYFPKPKAHTFFIVLTKIYLQNILMYLTTEEVMIQ